MELNLGNAYQLGSKVTLYVPSTVDVKKKINNRKYVDRVLTSFSGWFGGATSTKALGCWLSSDGSLVKEMVTMVFAFCNDAQLEEYISSVDDLARSLKKEMNQETIALEINGKMYFI